MYPYILFSMLKVISENSSENLNCSIFIVQNMLKRQIQLILTSLLMQFTLCFQKAIVFLILVSDAYEHQ